MEGGDMRFSQLCVFLLVATFGIRGQERPQSAAAIEGFVTSDVTAVVPGATIHLDSLTRGYHREATTSTSGYYLMEEVQPGAYSLYAEVRGFGCIIYPHIALMPGQRLRQDFVFVRAKRTPSDCEPPEKARKGK
jgi:hypothetical protein